MHCSIEGEPGRFSVFSVPSVGNLSDRAFLGWTNRDLLRLDSFGVTEYVGFHGVCAAQPPPKAGRKNAGRQGNEGQRNKTYSPDPHSPAISVEEFQFPFQPQRRDGRREKLLPSPLDAIVELARDLR